MVPVREKTKCQARVWSGFQMYDCSKKSKVERDGKWYCGTHDPVRVKEKKDARSAKWDADMAADRAARVKRENLAAAERKVIVAAEADYDGLQGSGRDLRVAIQDLRRVRES